MDPQPTDEQPPAKKPPPRLQEGRPLIFRSEDLFQGSREVWIEHGEVLYRLRMTAAGKLYLTK